MYCFVRDKFSAGFNFIAQTSIKIAESTNCSDGCDTTEQFILAANQGISVPGGHMAGSVAVAASTIPDALKQLEKAKQEKVDLIKLMITGGVLFC